MLRAPKVIKNPKSVRITHAGSLHSSYNPKNRANNKVTKKNNFKWGSKDFIRLILRPHIFIKNCLKTCFMNILNSDQIFSTVHFASKLSKMQQNEGMLSGWSQFWGITEVWVAEHEFRPNFQHCPISLKMEWNAAEWRYAEWLVTVLRNNGDTSGQRWIPTKYSALSDLPCNGTKCSRTKVRWVVGHSFEE